MLVCIPSSFRILTCFPRETHTTRFCCVHPPAACPPLSSTFWTGGQISAAWVGGSAGWKTRCSCELFRYAELSVGGGFDSRSSWGMCYLAHLSLPIRRQKSSFHHFRFYFFLSFALAYAFHRLLPFSEQCCSLGKSCCLSSCYFDQYSCLCSTAAYLLNFACLKIIGDAAGRPAGSQKSCRSCEVCQETGNPSCAAGVLYSKAAASGKSNPVVLCWSD